MDKCKMSDEKYWCCDAEFGEHAMTCKNINISKEKLKEILEECLELIGELIDSEECRYDHENYCQSHSLHEYPCPHARAKKMLQEIVKLKKVNPEIVNHYVVMEKSDEEIMGRINLSLMSDIGEKNDLEDEME